MENLPEISYYKDLEGIEAVCVSQYTFAQNRTIGFYAEWTPVMLHAPYRCICLWFVKGKFTRGKDGRRISDQPVKK